MKKKVNNKGFTLVEVIIAVAILGIVMIPIFQNLITSSRINQKGRKVLNATNMAQNVMEGFSAFSGDEIIKAFASYDATNKLVIMPAGMNYKSYGEISDGANENLRFNANTGALETPANSAYVRLDAAGKIKDILRNNTTHTYRYFVNEVEGAKNTLYDLKVTLDATNYLDSQKVDVSNITSINGAYDCVWLDQASDRTTAIQQLYDNRYNSGDTYDQIKKAYKREMVIRIYDENAGVIGSSPNYCISFTNNYEAKSGNQWYYATYSAPYTDGGFKKYDSNTTGQIPRNIYVYWWPNYCDTDIQRDSIIVQNDAGLKVNIYLIKLQTTPEGATPLATLENNYVMNLKVSGKFNDVVFSDYTDPKYINAFRKDMMLICTNIRENVAYTHEKCMEQNESAPVKDNNDYVKKGRLVIDTSDVKDKNNSTLTDGEKMIEELFTYTEETLVYDITLEVYDHSNGSKVATITGSTSY